MTRPNDIVWLASFPKSGSTWLRLFLSNYLDGAGAETDINNLSIFENIVDRHRFELVTMLDSDLLNAEEIDNLRAQVHAGMAQSQGPRRWIKTHDAFTACADGNPLFGPGPGIRAIYIVRDPRDVAVSLAHHFAFGIDAAIDLMNFPESAISVSTSGAAPQLRQRLLGWSSHIASWLDQREIPVHVMRYEDMQADPEAAFCDALRFAAQSVESEIVRRAVRHVDFSAMQRQETERGFAERVSETTPFFRSGRAGAWREVLTDTQVHAIEAAHGLGMIRLGYPLSR